VQDDAVAPHERDRDVAEGRRERLGAGGEHGDDAERLERQPRALDRLQRPREADPLRREDLRRGLREPVQRLDRRQELHRLSFGDRRPCSATITPAISSHSSITACAARMR